MTDMKIYQLSPGYVGNRVAGSSIIESAIQYDLILKYHWINRIDDKLVLISSGKANSLAKILAKMHDIGSLNAGSVTFMETAPHRHILMFFTHPDELYAYIQAQPPIVGSNKAIINSAYRIALKFKYIELISSVEELITVYNANQKHRREIYRKLLKYTNLNDEHIKKGFMKRNMINVLKK